MKKRNLIKRIEALEEKVAELERRSSMMTWTYPTPPNKPIILPYEPYRATNTGVDVTRYYGTVSQSL